MNRLILFGALSILFGAFSSCQKTELIESGQEAQVSEVVAMLVEETQVSQQEAMVDQLMTDIDVFIDEVIGYEELFLKSANTERPSSYTECLVVTIDKESAPQVMTLDYGTGCVGKDGRTRSGKIIVTAESFKTFPSSQTKTFDNFYVDGRKIEGSVSKTKDNDKENRIRTVVLVEDITITLPNDEGTLTRSANLTRMYYKNEVENTADDVTVSWGSVETLRNTNTTVTKTISAETPLVFKAECSQIVSGIAVFANIDRTWSIDYGNGDCDGVATLIRGDKTKEIKLNK